MMLKQMKKAVSIFLLGLSVLGASLPAYANGEESRVVIKTFESLDIDAFNSLCSVVYGEKDYSYLYNMGY